MKNTERQKTLVRKHGLRAEQPYCDYCENKESICLASTVAVVRDKTPCATAYNRMTRK